MKVLFYSALFLFRTVDSLSKNVKKIQKNYGKRIYILTSAEESESACHWFQEPACVVNQQQNHPNSGKSLMTSTIFYMVFIYVFVSCIAHGPTYVLSNSFTRPGLVDGICHWWFIGLSIGGVLIFCLFFV